MKGQAIDPPGAELEKIYALNLSETEEALVLGGNFLRLILKADKGRVGKLEAA